MNNTEMKNHMQSDSRVLIFLEDELQVRDFLKRDFGILQNKVVVALTPFAINELDRNDLQYRIIEDYYTSEEIYSIGIENYAKVEKICRIIDSKIQEKNKKIKEYDITPAFYNFYQIKINYDSILLRLFGLLKILEKEEPDVLIFYKQKKTNLISETLLPDNDESIYSEILEVLEWNRKLALIPEITDNEIKKREKKLDITKRIENPLKKFVLSHSSLTDLAVSLKKRGFKQLLIGAGYSIIKKNQTPVLLYGGGYNWDYCLNTLKKNGFFPIIRINEGMLNTVSYKEKKSLSVVLNELKKDEGFRNLFLLGDKDIFPLIEKKLVLIIEHLSYDCIHAYECTSNIIMDKKPRVLLVSTFAECFGHSVSKAAKNARVPVINWEHGPHGFFISRMKEYVDFISSDFYFSWGEGLFKEYSSKAKMHDNKTLVVGSSKQDTLFLKNFKTSKSRKYRRIVYVTSHYYQNHNYIFCYPPFSDNTYWEVQKKLIGALNNSKFEEVIVKLSPGHEYRDPPFREFIQQYNDFKKIRFIKNEKTFMKLLKIADVFLIDNPSTVLFEALTTKKPIFVYSGHLKYEPEEYEKLKKRTHCYENIDELCTSLINFSKGEQIQKVDLENTELLKSSGMYKLDCKACERVTLGIKQILNNEV